MAKLKAFLILTRPHFLLGGLLLFALGVSAAGAVNWTRYVISQLMVTSAQVTAHYVNEYFDIEADELVEQRTLFSGGSGVLAARSLAPRVAMRAAVATSLLAIAAAAAVASWSWQAAVLGIAALTISWAYSAPPIRLLETGWGEAATSVVVAALVPVIGVSSMGGSITPFLGWAIAALVPVHMAMMLAFEMPDVKTDRNAGKTVLAVRLGEISTYRLLVANYLLAYIAVGGGVAFSQSASSFWLAGTVAAVPIVATLYLARARHFSLLTLSSVVALVGPALALLLAAPTVSTG